ncbi:MAG: beta-propeller domain-containing protein [Ruminococcus sp.]|nr:beta-propeller domain-containing protein [Ruminococcus sp.]
MNHNDDKVKDLLENVEIPDEISPENMKKMLDEKAPAKKRSGISMAGRVTAAAVACAVLVGAAVGTSGLISRDRKGGEKCVQPVETEIPIETVTIPTSSAVMAEGAYMNGAESYEQVYKLVEKASKAMDDYRYSINGGIYFDDVKLESAVESMEYGSDIESEAPAVDGAAGALQEEEPQFVVKGEESENIEEEIPEEETKKDYSDTYNQEENVLEADIVKTDGERIYYIYNDYFDEVYFDSARKSYTEDISSRMNIAAVEDGIFTETYTLEFDEGAAYQQEGWKTDVNVRDMYIYNGMLAVVGNIYSYCDNYTMYGEDYEGEFFYDEESMTFVSFYTQENQPQLIGTYTQEGNYSDVRIAPDGYMYLMTAYNTGNFSEIDGADDIDGYVPKCGTDNLEYISACDILLPEDDLDNYEYMSYTVIGSIDLTVNGEFSPCETKALAGYSGELYASADNLYTMTGYSDTDITRIAIGGGQIIPEASGTVEGYVKDQFSLSEYNGFLRVAATINKWDDNSNFIKDALNIPSESYHIHENIVYVLDMDMNMVGEVGGFGKDEDIKSVSFSGDMGYVVTYEQTDPLFAIDLTDPENPFITDDFEILGYSTYMQQWDEGLLLGFGADADEYGRENGVKLVMFDNYDPYDLKEVGLYPINGSDNCYISSQAMWERKALLIAPEKNLIGVPVFVNNYGEEGFGYEDKYMFFSYEYGEFIFKGELNHDMDEMVSVNLDRALYIGDYVYALSGNCFISADIETLTETDRFYFD